MNPTVIMTLTMSPAIQSALSQVQQLRDSIAQTLGNITTTIYIKKVEETEKRYREQAQALRTTGEEHISQGMSVLKPVESTVRSYADKRQALDELKIAINAAGVPAAQLEDELRKVQSEAERLADQTRFSNVEAYNYMTLLINRGAELKDVYGGLGEAALYAAQAWNIDPQKAADGMLQISNAYKLGGQQMQEAVDMLNRLDPSGGLLAGFKQAAVPAGQLKQVFKDTAVTLAVLKSQGFDENSVGADYAAFLQKLNPVSPEQQADMARLGLLDGSGNSIFFDDQGKIKEMAEVVSILRDSFKDMRLDEVQRELNKIFGESGGQVAMALRMQQGKGSWEEVTAKSAKLTPITESVAMQQNTPKGKEKSVIKSLQNLSAALGKPVGEFIISQLDGLTALINRVRELAVAYPQVTKGIMWLVTGLGLFKVGVGGFNVLRSVFMTFRADAMMVWSWFARIAAGAGNLKAGFDLIRATGGGFWSSIWNGAKLAWPWLQRISGWVGRFVGQWAMSALRIAAGWLVAMGPVGWIILAVSAIIAAAIVAWQTNFMGFRDIATNVWNRVTGWIQTGIEAWKGYFDGFLVKVTEVWDGVWAKITKIWKNIQPYIDGVKNFFKVGGNLSAEGAVDPLGFGGTAEDFALAQAAGSQTRNSMTVSQNNNVIVKNTDEAADYVSKSLPGMYYRSRNA